MLTSKCASRYNGVHFFDISTSKSGPNPCVFNILTSKCASRHNGVHFFDISTSKSGPDETSSFFEVDHIKNEAILRDFLIVQSWQHHKRSTSARLLQFFNLTTSKTKQFCETSFKNGKLSAELTASYQCVLRFFQSTCRKYCACHEKVMPSHTKCCTCHAKSPQQTWRSDAPKCNPSQEISALTS